MHHFLPALEAIGRQLHDLTFPVLPSREMGVPAFSDATRSSSKDRGDTSASSKVTATGGDSTSESDEDSSDNNAAEAGYAPEAAFRDIKPSLIQSAEQEGAGGFGPVHAAPLHLTITYRLLAMSRSLGW
jgi:hypothetical protein